MTILDGKKVSNDIKNEIAAEVKKMKDAGEKVPHLAAVIVGDDGASLTYVGSKVRSCERVGFESTMVRMSHTTSELELLDKIKELNHNDAIDGFSAFLYLFPQSNYASNAQYWLSESIYALGDYQGSMINFAKIIQNEKLKIVK